MTAIVLTINDSRVDFGHVWVHMQDVTGKRSVVYSAVVPFSNCIEVFDPHRAKPNKQSWREYLMREVADLGTFILGAYFENMAKLVGDTAQGYCWVVATLDDVVEEDEAVKLKGRALVFDPTRAV